MIVEPDSLLSHFDFFPPFILSLVLFLALFQINNKNKDTDE